MRSFVWSRMRTHAHTHTLTRTRAHPHTHTRTPCRGQSCVPSVALFVSKADLSCVSNLLLVRWTCFSSSFFSTFFSSSPSRRNAEGGGYQVQSASTTALGVLTTSYVLPTWRQVNEAGILSHAHIVYVLRYCVRWTNSISCTCRCWDFTHNGSRLHYTWSSLRSKKSVLKLHNLYLFFNKSLFR